MKGFSFIIEAVAFFLALALIYLLSQYALNNSSQNKFINSIKDCTPGIVCYEGPVEMDREELEKLNISVVGEGKYGVMYLNNESKLILRLR